MDKYLFFRSNISFIHVIRLLTVAHFHHTKKCIRTHSTTAKKLTATVLITLAQRIIKYSIWWKWNIFCCCDWNPIQLNSECESAKLFSWKTKSGEPWNETERNGTGRDGYYIFSRKLHFDGEHKKGIEHSADLMHPRTRDATARERRKIRHSANMKWTK